MMKELNEAKEEYESIPIPRELSGRVLEGIRRGQSARRTRRLRQWTGEWLRALRRRRSA